LVYEECRLLKKGDVDSIFEWVGSAYQVIGAYFKLIAGKS
jgi:hypothetical protein